MQSSRTKRWAAGIVLACAAFLFTPGIGVGTAAAAVPDLLRDNYVNPVAPDGNGALPPGWINTQWGPYGPADQALLENVRRADLWEGEGAAIMGLQKGTTDRIKQVAKVLIEQHQALEAGLVKIAGQMNITNLPTQPNSDQQGWLGEMSAANGKQFDQVWVDRLRAAHGKIFSMIATVRANTRNSLVRDFANAGNTAVATHMALLESTGLVKFNELPTPVAPTTAGGVFARTPDSSGSPTFLWIVLALGAVGCIAAATTIIRTRQ